MLIATITSSATYESHQVSYHHLHLPTLEISELQSRFPAIIPCFDTRANLNVDAGYRLPTIKLGHDNRQL